MSTHILLRGDTAANWTSANPVLQAREPGIETDTQKFKFGDGVTTWTGLPYATGTATSSSTTSVESYATPLTGGSALSVDLSGSQTVFPITLNVASCAISFTNVTNGRTWTLKLKQDATGGRAVTLPGVTLLNGNAITLDVTANGVTFLTMLKDVDGTYAFVAATGGSTSSTTPPGQTLGLTAGVATASTQPLTWTATTGATSYLVEYKAASSSTWLSGATVATAAATITGLNPSTSYNYRVTPSNSAGVGTVSATATATTAAGSATVPGQTTGLAAGTATQSTQPLTWTATSTATTYLVEYKASSSGTWLTSGTVSTTAATVSGLTAATSYDYRVTPSNSAGAGTTSAVLTASTAAAFTSARFVGERNVRNVNVTTTADTGGTYQLEQIAHESVSAVSLTFANWYTPQGGAGDSNGANNFTVVDCFVVTGTGSTKTLTRVQFSGSNSATITPGSTAVGTATVAISAGSTYWIRSYVTPAAGGSYPILDVGSTAYPDELSQVGSNVASNTAGDFTTFLTNYGSVVGPIQVVGVPTGTHASVAVIGDSIAWGNNDNFGNALTIGFIVRALTGNRAFLKYAIPGESFADYLGTSGAKRRPLIGPNADYLICEYGVNDIQQAASLATLQSRALSTWTQAVTANSVLKVFQTTLTPQSSSTDAWVTTTNQTTSGNNPTRIGFNNWIRAGAPIDPSSKNAVAIGTNGALLAGAVGHPLKGFFEIADLVESARDSGIWKANFTDDGLHPIQAGHVAMAAGITLSSLPLL